MDTDEAGEVSLEPEGTAVDTQKKLCVFEKYNTLFIRWGYTLECDRALKGRFGRKPSCYLKKPREPLSSSESFSQCSSFLQLREAAPSLHFCILRGNFVAKIS